ncbi:MAG TPA: HEPN domain-containing protein, partial [Anaerolineales bacterium]|nr:HEPN domain-containing protein [Anaerolineales bacterium]
LVSLLIHTAQDYYEGRSFILDANSGWFQEIKPNHFVCIQFFMFTAFSGEREVAEKDDTRWLYFPAVKERLIEIGKLIDNLLNSKAKDKLLYVASLLKNAGHDIKEDKTKLVVLVSIMELLLTHNPKFDRYNVEDSINKQFQLKAATLIYLNDKSRNINHIKARLNEIYGLRSSVAHGDFKAITKYFETAKKKDEKFPIGTVIGELYIYLRAIITEYLLDDNFVDFLKDG